MKEWWILDWDTATHGGNCGICSQRCPTALRLLVESVEQGYGLVSFLRGLGVTASMDNAPRIYLQLCPDHERVITPLTVNKLLTEEIVRAAITPQP